MSNVPKRGLENEWAGGDSNPHSLQTQLVATGEKRRVVVGRRVANGREKGLDCSNCRKLAAALLALAGCSQPVGLVGNVDQHLAIYDDADAGVRCYFRRSTGAYADSSALSCVRLSP